MVLLRSVISTKQTFVHLVDLKIFVVKYYITWKDNNSFLRISHWTRKIFFSLHVIIILSFFLYSQEYWLQPLLSSPSSTSSSTLSPSVHSSSSTWSPMPSFTDVTSQSGPQIHGQLSHSSAPSLSLQSSSHSSGNSLHRATPRPSCSELAAPPPLLFFRYSIALSSKLGSLSSGASRWCHGFPPFQSFSTSSCWVRSMALLMSGSESFRVSSCLFMFCTVFMPALMPKEKPLSAKRMVKLSKNLKKEWILLLPKCKNTSFYFF